MPIGVGTAMLIGGGMQTLGALFSGFSQGKISKDQLRLQAKQLGLNEMQIEHMIAQAERQNRVQTHNVGRMNPMLDAMIARGQEGAEARPSAIRLQPPAMTRNNPHAAAAAPPPPITGIPGLDYSQMNTEDPREVVRRLMMGGR